MKVKYALISMLMLLGVVGCSSNSYPPEMPTTDQEEIMNMSEQEFEQWHQQMQEYNQYLKELNKGLKEEAESMQNYANSLKEKNK